MADFAVSTAFTAQDKVTRAFRRMAGGAGKFESRATRAFKNSGRAASRFGSIVKGVLAAGIIRRGFDLIAQGVRVAVTEFVDFDDAIVAATARFKDLPIGSEKARKAMEALRKKAREVGATTEFTAAQSAQGLDFFARAGFKSAEAMAILKNQTDLATVAGGDFARNADISSDLLGALGLNAKDSATKIANLKKLNNSLAVATNQANVTMEDLFETLKASGPIATAAGEGFQKQIAITAAIASSGIKGSNAATALKNAQLRLIGPTKAVEKTLGKMGLSAKSFVDQSGKMKGMTDIMALLGKNTKKLKQAEKLRFFKEVFGLRAIAGAINMAKNLEQIDEIMTAMKDENAMKKIAVEMRKSLGNRLKALKSALTEVGFKFFSAFRKEGAGGLDALTKAARKFDVKHLVTFAKELFHGFKMLGPPLNKFMKAMVKFFGNILPKTKNKLTGVNSSMGTFFGMLVVVLEVSEKLLTTLTPLAPLLVGLASAFIAFKVVTTVISIIGAVSTVLGLLAAKLGFATAAQWLFNVALTANPIGAIIVGIAALIGIIVLLVIHWDKVTAALTATWDFLGRNAELILGLFGGLLGPLGAVVFVVLALRRNWEKIVSAFKNQGIIAGIKSIGDAILQGLVAPVQQLLKLLSMIPGVGKFAKSALEKVNQFSANIDKRLDARAAPNKTETETRQSQVQFDARFTLGGFPPGTKIKEATRGAGRVRTELMGAQP